MAEKRRYGIGLQWFPDIIEKRTIYVDKTAQVYKLANHGGKNYFLSRPRRFGKSLLLSTLQCYFEGRRELFRGLAVEKLEKDWVKYPVLRLDLSNGKYYDETSVDDICGGILRRLEEDYGLSANKGDKLSDRLTNLIRAAYQQTGRQVVVLIDEYDAPMLDSVHKPALQDHLRERVRDLFSPLKGQAELLKFVLLTGISKFSQLSVFSELNNLNVLTFNPEFEDLCGITEQELFTQLKPDIEWLAEASGRFGGRQMSYEETVQKLKQMYDGYHFNKYMTDIYNPWSLFYAFEQGEIDNYWFSTGTPTSLINLLRVKQIQLTDLEHIEVKQSVFDAPTERITDPIPVLYQSGYLTLKEYHPEEGTYTLGFPNDEVYRGFASSLYKYICEEYTGSENQMDIAFLRLRRGCTTFEQFLESLRKWYAGIPYSITDKNQKEQFYQSLFYALMVGVGADVEAEGQTSDGRFDIALKLQDAIYILEFKFGGSAEQAAAQVLAKDYAVRFAADRRPVWAVGLNISKDRRTIESCQVVKVKSEE